MAKVPIPRSRLLRALKFLFQTRAGTAVLGGTAGMAGGYRLGHYMHGRLASAFMPEGYRVEPRMRVVRERRIP